MIEFKNVSASYDGELAVLNDVSFTVNDGDFVAFVGTNGAGKSTTMRLANGLLKPTSGEVLIDGVPTTSLRTSELARRIGFLFQNPDRQICCNTVREELLFGFKAQGRLDEQAQEKVDAMIEHFNFDADAEPFLLNRGTRQLLALASILVTEPEVLILDEPTTGLDYRECCKVMEVIERAHQKGTTVVMVCHDLPDVFAVSDRIVVIRQGHVTGVHRTVETSYEEIIAEIAGVTTEHEYEEIAENPKFDSMVRQRKLIDRTISAAVSHGTGHDSPLD